MLSGIMTKLISWNAVISTKKLQVFLTATDGQTAIKVKIYQGEHELVCDNKLLGNFNCIPPAPNGMPQIKITFSLPSQTLFNLSIHAVQVQDHYYLHYSSSSSMTYSSTLSISNPACFLKI